MASKPRIVAIWQECEIEIAPALDTETFPTEGLASIGVIKEKTTTLETSDGETLELKGSGGHTVDIVETEGGYALKTTVIEPDALYKTLGLSDTDLATGEQDIKTHVVDARYAVKLTPKRVGGIGVKAPVTMVSFKPSGSEEEGGAAEVTFTFIKPQASATWYTRFKKAASA